LVTRLPRGKDEFWPSRIVAETRVYLASIYDGEFSENFYSNMLLIAEYEVYKGYKTAHGKDIKLKGIKDFLYNLHYGLGIRNLQEFMLLISRLAVEDNSNMQYADRLLDWLRTQDPVFNFSRETWEYRRIVGALKKGKLGEKQPKKGIGYKRKTGKDWKAFCYLKVLFHNHPGSLRDIGEGRKYRNVYEAALDHGVILHRNDKPILKIKAPGTSAEFELTAQHICDKLGARKAKVLLREMVEYIKICEKHNGI
jgi:hypothetical protein